MQENLYIFRTATNQDTDKIVSLVKKILPEFDLLYSPETSERDLQDIEGTYMKKGGTFEVIENEQKEIIGTVALLNLGKGRCKLRKMYIDIRYRKLGFAHLLLKKILHIAGESGFREVTLETVHSMTAAISLYEKYGFQKVDGPQSASPRCDIIMSKTLYE